MEVETHGALTSFELNQQPPPSPPPPFSCFPHHSDLRASSPSHTSLISSSATAAADADDDDDDNAAVRDHSGERMASILISDDASLIGGHSAGEASETAARKVQKVYRSYRTRRMLADSAVVAEELWWQALDYARLNHSTISFFNFSKAETAASRWNRISHNASKVGKGLALDSKAQKLAFQHWIEAIDPRHRYGHGLHKYYEAWCQADAGQPFFYW